MDNKLTPVVALLKQSTKLKDIGKDDLVDMIRIYRKGLEDASIHKHMSASQLQEFTKHVNATRGDVKKRGCSTYHMLRDRMLSGASAIERKSVFAVFEMAITNYIQLLNLFEKDLDKLFANNVISIHNVRLSHVAILGVIGNAGLLAEYIPFLFGAMMYDLDGSKELVVPPYRYAFLETHLEQVVGLLNNVTVRQGDTAILKEIGTLKQKNTDVVVVNDKNEVNAGLIGIAMNGFNINSMLRPGFINLNVFQWRGEIWNRWRDNRYRNIENRKIWLETHIALLKMKLDNTSDVETKNQLKKIVSNYDAMLSKLDADISDYRNN